MAQERRREPGNDLPNSLVLVEGLGISHPQREMVNENVPPQAIFGTGETQQIHIQEEPEPPSLPQSIIGSNHTPHMAVDTASTIHSTPPTTLFATEGGGDSATQYSLESALWESRVDPGWTSWLTGVDFDLDAVNMCLLQATYDPGPPMPNDPDINIMGINDPEISHDDGHGENLDSIIQRRWHTYFEQPSSGTRTPNIFQGRSHIDETYRGRLNDSLRQRVQNGILPSTAFLV